MTDCSRPNPADTASTRLRAALRDSEERLDLILRGSNDGFWDWNAATGELYLAPRWLEMLGYDPGDLKPGMQAWETVCHPDDLPGLMEAVSAHLTGEAPSHLEIEHRIKTKSGEWRWILTRGKSGARDEQGKASRIAGTATDITDRKLAEEELRQHRDLLDELVAQRTLELAEANAQLQFDNARRKRAEEQAREHAALLKCKNIELEAHRGQLQAQQQELIAANRALEKARTAAEAANRTKSEFLANMSHEIRTPMNGIIGMTELVLGTELGDEQREHLATAMECAESLLALLNDILDFSKIEAGRLDLETIEFNPAAPLEGVADLLRHQAAEKNLELICDIQPDVPGFIRGDPVRLRQVLMNLVGNAIKFTEHGEVVVSVALERQTEGEVTLLFSVCDTGIGIPKDRQQAIFGSFTQADGAITRKYGGSGLGLTISKQIVGLMGGEIWVESEEGRGSTFSFRVAFQVVGPKNGTPEDDAGQLARARRILRGRRILVVDDNATNLRILCRALEMWGCPPQSASAGAQALDMLSSAANAGHPFELVILDVQMPEMDGFQVGRAIGTDTSYGSPQVLFLSSLGPKGDPADQVDLPCARFLSKPVRQSVLLDTLLGIFTGNAGRESGETHKSEPVVNRRRFQTRVLLVEDNFVNRKVATGILEKCHYDVTAVDSGAAALEILTLRSFDIVITDVQMPGMDGLEVVRRIRADDKLRDLPVIAMTAHAMKGDREDCLEAGMDDYLTKPVRAEELQQMVEKWAPGSSARGVAAAAEPAREAPSPAEIPIFPADSPVNPHKAVKQLGGDRALFAEVLAAFLEDLPHMLNEVRDAVTGADAARLRVAAHSLKGAASNICAEPTRTVSQRLEQTAKRGDLQGADSMLQELENHLERLQEFAASLESV